MKNRSLKIILVLLCAALIGDFLYIAVFPCTWGYSLYVDDVLIGSLKEESSFSEILDHVKEPYLNENTLSCEFIESVEIRKEKFLKEQLSNRSSEQIAAALSKNKEEPVLYKVKPGDTWSEIAEKHGQTSRELLAKNPGYNINTLQPGSTLVVAASVPTISVMTTENRTYEEEIPFETIYLEQDDSLSDFTYLLIQIGSCGVAETTAKITFVNGTETSREILSSTVLVEPISQVMAMVPVK
jgi:LysM repeat protein